MKQNQKETMAKIGKFFKKNGYYFLIVICIAAVASMIGVAISQNNKKNMVAKVDDDYVNAPNSPDDSQNETPPPDEQDNDPEPIVDVLTFALPVNGTVSIEYSAIETSYNQTLKEWFWHNGMDFVSSDDLNVYTAATGVVKEVDYDVLSGNYVVIEHADGYTTVYKSLGEDVKVTEGQSVEKGDVLGKMSDSMGDEFLDGVHLHFEVMLDGENINPLEVLIVEEK